MSDAEVMSTAIAAALCFSAHVERACSVLKRLGYMPPMLSPSRFNRRLHAVQDHRAGLCVVLGACFKALHAQAVYVIDSARSRYGFCSAAMPLALKRVNSA